MLVKPTKRWNSLELSTYVGTFVRRADINQPVEVPDSAVAYLEQNKLAFALSSDELSTSSDPVLTSTKTSNDPEIDQDNSTDLDAISLDAETTDEGVNESTDTSESDENQDSEVIEVDWEEIALDFIQESPAARIAEELKGVGKVTANELKNVDPITWEHVLSVLNDGQLASLKEWVETNY